MNDLKFCGHAVIVDGTKVGKAIVTEEDQPPEEKVIIVGVVDGPHKPGFVLSYDGTWALIKKLLAAVGDSPNGHADDARSMLCRRDKT